jgi:hypothetical protein
MANPLIIGFISALAGIGLTNLIPKAEADGSTTIFQGEKPIVNVPQNLLQATVELPIRDLSVSFRRFAMPATKGAPQINLQNNINGNRLLSFQIIPDATSKLTGQIELEINNKLIMETDAGDFTDTDALSLPIPEEGLELVQGGGVKVTGWDSATGNITMIVVTGVK